MRRKPSITVITPATYNGDPDHAALADKLLRRLGVAPTECCSITYGGGLWHFQLLRRDWLGHIVIHKGDICYSIATLPVLPEDAS